jgi:hypothetical protein
LINSTPNIVFATNPPQYPSQQETCSNCGLIRYHREKTEKWIEYSDGEAHKDCYVDESGTITIGGTDLTKAGTTTLIVP